MNRSFVLAALRLNTATPTYILLPTGTTATSEGWMWSQHTHLQLPVCLCSHQSTLLVYWVPVP